MAGRAEELAALGFTTIWLPPFTQSVSAEVRCQQPLSVGDGALSSAVAVSGLQRQARLPPVRLLTASARRFHCVVLQGYPPGDLF